MTGTTHAQPVVIVSTVVGEDEIAEITRQLSRRRRRSVLTLVAPSADAKRIATGLAQQCALDLRPEVLLAPVAGPVPDRSHQLDDLVRRHVVADRFRDVLVVADPDTVALLVRSLAGAAAGADSGWAVIGLPRGVRPLPTWPAVAGGGVLALASAVLGEGAWILAPPAALAALGMVLLLARRVRHLGMALLLAAALAAAMLVLSVSSSARFPNQ